MNELRNTILQYEKLKEAQTPSVLATVVHVEGSAYRRAGARMIVDETGNMYGAISGGCLEGDALKKALYALYKNQKKVIEYDTSDESDAVLGAQLGCNGLIKVIFEPIDFEDPKNPMEILKWAEKQSIPTNVLIHYSENEKVIGTFWAGNSDAYFENQQISEVIGAEIKSATGKGINYFTLNNEAYFINKLKPPFHLLIIGAGNDAVVLSQMAALLGWEISILDGRHTHATDQRFAENCQVYLGDALEVLKCIKNPENTALVLISHNFQYDLKVLKQIHPLKNLPYVGILGPKKKFNKLLDTLKEAGIVLENDALNGLYSPMGFDIGAETPAEIALATLAEIQAVINQKNGGSLREKPGRIHD